MHRKRTQSRISRDWLVVFLVVTLALASGGVAMAASEVFLNDSGEAARAILITFSEPVEITGFDDTFEYQSPKGKAQRLSLPGLLSMNGGRSGSRGVQAQRP